MKTRIFSALLALCFFTSPAMACPAGDCAFELNPMAPIPDADFMEEEACAEEEVECEEGVFECGWIISQINIEGTGANVTGDFSLDINITHTYRGDLVLILFSPMETEVLLKQFTDEDDADDLVGNYPNTLIPEEDLAPLIGQPLDGTWVLLVMDCYEEDTGVLNSWAINNGECAVRSLGDLNGNGLLDRKDWDLFRGYLGTDTEDAGYSECADMNGDGKVSWDDGRILVRSIRGNLAPAPIN